MATPEHSESLLLENYVRIVTLAPDLRKVSFYSAIEFHKRGKENGMGRCIRLQHKEHAYVGLSLAVA
jgi:hypothetical protein